MLGELRASISAREALEQTIQELSSPVLPVLEGILVMPLIGVIDGERADLSLFAMIRHTHAARPDGTVCDAAASGVPHRRQLAVLREYPDAEVLPRAAAEDRTL